MLLRYLFYRSLIGVDRSALSDSSAAQLAPLLSTLIISGSPFLSMAFSKKRRAASGLVTMGAQQEIDRVAFLVDGERVHVS
jgi:hypothetical protein